MSKAAGLKVERVERSVIEKKLLVALEDKGQVAILASKEDLGLLIRALEELLDIRNNASYFKIKDYKKDLERLRQEAFGK